VNILPGMNAGASTYAVPSPIKGSGTAWVLLGSWALSPARPTPIHPRHECRGLSALFGDEKTIAIQAFDDSTLEARLVNTVEQVDSGVLSALADLIRIANDTDNLLRPTA
jgi:hypothetical protein